MYDPAMLGYAKVDPALLGLPVLCKYYRKR